MIEEIGLSLVYAEVILPEYRIVMVVVAPGITAGCRCESAVACTLFHLAVAIEAEVAVDVDAPLGIMVLGMASHTKRDVELLQLGSPTRVIKQGRRMNVTSELDHVTSRAPLVGYSFERRVARVAGCFYEVMPVRGRAGKEDSSPL